MANGRTRNGSNVARLSLLLTVALAAPAWSQVQTGRIVGNVRDSQQAMVPRANVTVTASATGQAVNVTTNDRGDYVVTISAERQGCAFASSIRSLSRS